MNENKVLGIDIGYGYTKTHCDDGSKIFPTAVTRVVPVSTFGEVKPIIVNNEKFLVGEEAEREGKGLIDVRTTTFVTSNAWLSILGHALAINNYDHEGDTKIVLGVPPGQYNDNTVKNIVETVKRTTVKGKSFIGRNVKVIPQGAGIFFTYLSKFSDDIKKDIAIVDIGHYTLDMLSFSGGKYVENSTKSASLGISLVYDEIIKAFYSKYGLTVHYKDAKKLLANKAITILEETYRLDDLDGIMSSYAAQISSMIDGYFENLPTKPEIAIVAGGGVSCLRGIVKLKYKLHILENPDMANAIGYWHYGRRFAKW